jgi:acetate---CoA ligase (ADP-forming)
VINFMKNNLNLNELLNPRSIAVVGATNTPGRVGRIIFEQLLNFNGPVYPVNIREKEILGKKSYAHVELLPEIVDLAVIAIKAESVVRVAHDCARKGIPMLIVVASGFSESGEKGKALEDWLVAITQNSGSRILGPNTLGLFLPHNRLDTIFVDHGDKALAGGGGVAFISQSGSVGTEALGLASNTGFGLRAFVGLGNKCDLNEMDFLSWFSQDPETTCLAFYIESLSKGRQFLEIARQASLIKPVVVLKAGRSEAGADAVSSHTGRLAGSDRVVGGAFRQYGVQRVFDDEELCDAAKALSCLPPALGNRVAILTPAGGYGVMGADHIEMIRGGIRLEMARLSDKTQERIRKISFSFASCRNPVDLTANANDRMIGDALSAIIDDEGVDIIICTAFFSPPSITDALVESIASGVRDSSKPIIVFTQYGPFTESYLRQFHREGVVGFPSIGRAVRAAGFLVERAEILQSIKA